MKANSRRNSTSCWDVRINSRTAWTTQKTAIVNTMTGGTLKSGSEGLVTGPFQGGPVQIGQPWRHRKQAGNPQGPQASSTASPR
jgi:hypothetical protein